MDTKGEGVEKEVRVMTDETPKQFPTYPSPQFASHQQARPLMKLMGRALQGRKGKSIFEGRKKRKKVRVV